MEHTTCSERRVRTRDTLESIAGKHGLAWQEPPPLDLKLSANGFCQLGPHTLPT